MPNVRSTHTAIVAVLAGFCYLVLSWASALHSIEHGSEAYSGSAPNPHHAVVHSGDAVSFAYDHSDDHHQLSVPCFLCLVGHSWTPLTSPPADLHESIDRSTFQTQVVTDPVSAERLLPYLRGPPSYS